MGARTSRGRCKTSFEPEQSLLSVGATLRPLQALRGNSLPIPRPSDQPQEKSLNSNQYRAGWLEPGDGSTA
ncbi:MAG: hypothetical protein ACFFD2_00035 [Promethearchaeota archaeon]